MFFSNSTLIGVNSRPDTYSIAIKYQGDSTFRVQLKRGHVVDAQENVTSADRSQAVGVVRSILENILHRAQEVSMYLAKSNPHALTGSMIENTCTKLQTVDECTIE